MDREQFFASFFPLVGGRDNTSLCEFQSGTLHVMLKDASLAQEDAISALPEVCSIRLRRSHLTVCFGDSVQNEEVPVMANKNIDYSALASEIIEKVGGKENICSVTHCVTRLRFTVKDSASVDLPRLQGTSGVLRLVISSGQYQLVIGPAVTDVYEEVMHILGDDFLPSAAQSDSSHKDNKLVSLAKQGLDTLIACFIPCISAFSGAGMIKVLIVLLSYLGLLSSDSSTYTILNTIGDGVFYFLPFFVAYNAAKKMNVDLFLSMSLAAIIMHPNLSALGEAGSSVDFLCFGMKIMDYSAQALPIIFGVWILKYVDCFADKISPKIVKIFLRPMISLLITAPIVLLVVGPVALALSNLFFKVCAGMQSWGWLSVAINAVFFPLMVLTGTHNATIPLIIQMFSVQGFDPIFLPSGMAANIAQAGAACAVAVKTKNHELRSTGLSATLSALVGITEPALYGVNLRMKRPFLSMMIGAFIGGAYIGLLGMTAPAFVTPSLLTVAVFSEQCGFLLALSSVPVTFIATFIITYLIGFEDIPENKES